MCFNIIYTTNFLQHTSAPKYAKAHQICDTRGRKGLNFFVLGGANSTYIYKTERASHSRISLVHNENGNVFGNWCWENYINYAATGFNTKKDEPPSFWQRFAYTA